MAALAVVGCAARRLENGVYYSSKGYRVAVPGSDWMRVDSRDADLELRRRGGVGMLANATCGAPSAVPSKVLAMRFAIELRNRVTIERDEVPVDGQPAAHSVLEGAVDVGGPPMRVETYVLTHDGCVYDLIYAAPPELFEGWRGDFARFVGSFVLGGR
jgi:hypothetical protein